MIGAAALALAACANKDENAEPSAEAATDAAPVEETAELPDEAKTGAELKAEFEKQAAENLAASEKFLEENKAREGVQVTDSGLQYMALEEGDGDGLTPTSTDLVVFEFAMTTADGVEISSSRAIGAAPQVRVSEIGVDMPGLAEGLQMMDEGDHYRFFLPPDLAYGDRIGPDAPFGPNETLIVDVELIKVQNPERNLELAKAFLAENAKKDGVKTTKSGLQYEVISEGPADGKSPAASDTVEVDYQGTLINGTEFDSSYARGQSATFPLSGVIAGWTEGLQLMSEGDKFRFFIPPELAYGARGGPGGSIGPNEALIFEVELIDVK
ncbi:peptidylprolyl isomerase [Marinicaulis flavus]|uniref:peptidylprolyl isomerase n=2 Tax=Hyphococcus luteus TaxID=2058213 RepID=A0A2S7KAS7_9PROT|nr:peptidylprolyl isomerase [Marinicaulis flavus]